MTPNGNVKIPTKVLLSILIISFTWAHFHSFKFYQEDIVQRNNSHSYGIVLVRGDVYPLFNYPYLRLIPMVL